MPDPAMDLPDDKGTYVQIASVPQMKRVEIVRFSASALEEYAAVFEAASKTGFRLGDPIKLKKLAATFLKHLGKDSFYELY